MNSLFLAIALSEIAGIQRRGHAIPAPRRASAKLALSDMREMDAGAQVALISAFALAKKDLRLARETAMGAFWKYYGTTMRLPGVKRRLLINPPANLQDLTANETVTIKTREWAGEYGPSYTSLKEPIVRQQAGGYFDDVVVFDHEGIEQDAWDALVLPKATVTVLAPGEMHWPWIGFLELPMWLPQSTDWLQFRHLYSDSQGEIFVKVFGVEGL